MGIRGVWGLSKGAIAWATGIMLLFLILHALLTFQIVGYYSEFLEMA